uniref:ShKT domain-containing protein n=1 Tax=Steinernema glaseri TaxID=37863 RepID=A0A1I8ASC3_9BILA
MKRYNKSSLELDCEDIETICSLIPEANTTLTEHYHIDLNKEKICGERQDKCKAQLKTKGGCPKAMEQKKATLKYALAGCGRTCNSCSSASNLYKYSEEMSKIVLS